MRLSYIAAAVLAAAFCSTLGAQPQCGMHNVVGKWAYNYSGWYIPLGGTTPVQISTHGVFIIDWSGKVTGPGTWAMGAPMAGTVPAGQMLEFDFTSGKIQVTSDCTGLLMTYLKFRTLPIPALGPYYGRIIVIPGRDEIEGMALKSPSPTEKPMWTYTLKRISPVPGDVEWLMPPSE